MSKENNGKLIFLDKYIDIINELNQKSKKEDIRLNFFINKKINSLIMAKHIVHCQPNFPWVETDYYKVELPYDLDSLNIKTKKDVKNFVYNDPDYIAFNNTKIASVEYSDLYTEQSLDNFMVLPKYRNEGLGRSLINEVVNSAINNNYTAIVGDVVPLDAKACINLTAGKDIPEQDKLINRMAYEKGIMKDLAYVDMSHLIEIYSKLGFKIEDSRVTCFKRLYMDVKNITLSVDKKLPNAYTSLRKNPETVIWFS